jgi:hypothetical protein
MGLVQRPNCHHHHLVVPMRTPHSCRHRLFLPFFWHAPHDQQVCRDDAPECVQSLFSVSYLPQYVHFVRLRPIYLYLILKHSITRPHDIWWQDFTLSNIAKQDPYITFKNIITSFHKITKTILNIGTHYKTFTHNPLHWETFHHIVKQSVTFVKQYVI